MSAPTATTTYVSTQATTRARAPRREASNAPMSHTVDVPAAADMLKVHPKTVLDLIDSGEIPAARVGRAYVMLTRDVLNHIEDAVIKQTAERMRRPMKTRTCSPKPCRKIATA